MNRLDPVRLGLAGGVVWGASLFVLTLVAQCFGYGRDFLVLFVALYPGYSITFAGSIVGAVIGFADAFVGLWILAWIYNKLGKK